MGLQGNNALKILAMTRYSRLGASSRMRLYQYVPILQELGIDVEVSPLLRDSYLRRLYARQPVQWYRIAFDYLRRAVGLIRARNYDLLWIEKELFPNCPAWFEQALGALGIPYIFDIDDAIFHNYDLSNNPYKKLLARKIDTVMRGSKLAVCGNNYLAQRARSAGASWVETVPTVIDLERYHVPPRPDRKQIVVGWCGSPSTVQYLDIVAPALKALAGEFPLQLRVVGAEFSCPDIDVDCRKWSEATEAREIQDFDIGIMPLRDSPWERGKCGYKLIQYMACAKAVVATSLGANTKIVDHGLNGYLVSTVEEWVEAIRVLVADPQKRRAEGMEGRSLVEKKYCLQVTAPRIARLLEECVASR